MRPNVTAIWPNYNSMHIIDTARASLKSIIAAARLSELRLVVVDNHSTDGSYEIISDYLKELDIDDYVIIRLNRNLGYSGAIRAGYEYAGRDSDYVVLLNNDIVLKEGSIDKIVQAMSKYGLGAAQGMILRNEGGIDNFGYYIDELLLDHPIPELGPRVKHLLYVTYVSGSFAVVDNYRLKKCIGNEPIMYEFIPAYFDDNLLGLRLWNCGHRVAALRVLAGHHLHSATYSKYPYTKVHHRILSYTVKTSVIKTRYAPLAGILRMKAGLRSLVKNGVLNPRGVAVMLRAIGEGIKYGWYLREKGLELNLYKAPYLRVDLTDLISSIASPKLGIRPSELLKRASLNYQQSSLGSPLL